MTEEEHEMIRKLAERQERMNRFLFHPPIEGKATRAEQIDEVLSAVRAGKIGTRVVLWLCGLVAAVAGAYAALRSGAK